MYCPRCGHKNEAKNRHCSNCGEALPDLASPEQPDLGVRLHAFGRRLVGTSRRDRWITGGIVAALVVAGIAFVALPADEDSSDEDSSAEASTFPELAIEAEDDERDPYIQELDDICLDSKVELQKAAEAAAEAKQVGVNGIRVYARRFGPITDEMLERIDALDSPPSQYQAKVAKLVSLLRQIGVAGRRAAGYPQAMGEQTLREFGRVQQIGGRVETIISDLGLTNCETIQVTTKG